MKGHNVVTVHVSMFRQLNEFMSYRCDGRNEAELLFTHHWSGRQGQWAAEKGKLEKELSEKEGETLLFQISVAPAEGAIDPLSLDQLGIKPLHSPDFLLLWLVFLILPF